MAALDRPSREPEQHEKQVVCDLCGFLDRTLLPRCFKAKIRLQNSHYAFVILWARRPLGLGGRFRLETPCPDEIEHRVHFPLIEPGPMFSADVDNDARVSSEVHPRHNVAARRTGRVPHGRLLRTRVRMTGMSGRRLLRSLDINSHRKIGMHYEDAVACAAHQVRPVPFLETAGTART